MIEHSIGRRTPAMFRDIDSCSVLRAEATGIGISLYPSDGGEACRFYLDMTAAQQLCCFLRLQLDGKDIPLVQIGRDVQDGGVRDDITAGSDTGDKTIK